MGPDRINGARPHVIKQLWIPQRLNGKLHDVMIFSDIKFTLRCYDM
jgi:hypothetical protein